MTVLPTSIDKPAFGVLVANLGSPAAPTPAALRRYLRQFLGDRRVVDLPRWKWWPILHLVILPLRSRRSARLYRTIWTEDGPPLPVMTRRIASELAARLGDGRARPMPVVVGMRYGAPSIGRALEDLNRAGCRRILVLPLYPQYSTTTTASIYDAVADGLSGLGRGPEVRAVTNYHDHPAYLSALARSVERFRRRHGPADRLMMSFHGIPQRIADAGDPYPEHCAATATALARRLELKPGSWHMAYQSRFGRDHWLRPALDARLRSWGRRGINGVDVICPGFATDCLETLEEVAVGGREIYESSGGHGYRYIPALNDDPDHVSALAAVVADHARDWSP